MTLYVSSSPIADRDQNYSAHAADACWTADGHTMQLAPANIHTQIAAGSALNTTTGFTIPTNNGNIGYSTQIILGGGGANPVNYTITGTWASNPQTDTIQAAGAGTYEGTKPFDSVTRLVSDVNPGGTTDLQTLDLFGIQPFRGVKVANVPGTLTCVFREDSADTSIPVGAYEMVPVECTRIRCSKSSGRASGVSATTIQITVGR